PGGVAGAGAAADARPRRVGRVAAAVHVADSRLAQPRPGVLLRRARRPRVASRDLADGVPARARRPRSDRRVVSRDGAAAVPQRAGGGGSGGVSGGDSAVLPAAGGRTDSVPVLEAVCGGVPVAYLEGKSAC